MTLNTNSLFGVWVFCFCFGIAVELGTAEAWVATTEEFSPTIEAELPPVFAQSKVDVDLALVLAVDCSWSVDGSEFLLQMQGLAQAFTSPSVIDAITRGGTGRIAVTLTQWSGLQNQKISVPWTIISSRESAHRLAVKLSATTRLLGGKTSISAVINFGVDQLISSPVTTNRYVIDISGDGVNNSGADRPDTARDRAVAAGVTINGLTILNEVNNLDIYFKEHVIGGPGNFVIVANDYQAYGEAIKRKLLQEIQGIKVSGYIQ